MSLRSPNRNTVLPLRIQQRLNEMYARSTGFSGPEILDFFARYDIEIESYPTSGAPSRKAMFEDCLARFDLQLQTKIVVDLLGYDGSFKYGSPSDGDIDFIKRWISDRQEVSGTDSNRRSISLPSTPLHSSPEVTPAVRWDVFLSHASEDKDAFARPLAKELRANGMRVWFDEFTLRIGDSLRRSIDKGLANSRFGVVVISPAFLNKEWPQKELDGLVAREMDGQKVILPVWHNVDADTIRRHSPLLADRLATSSAKGLPQVITELLTAIHWDGENSGTRLREIAQDTEQYADTRISIVLPNGEHAIWKQFVYDRRNGQLLGYLARVGPEGITIFTPVDEEKLIISPDEERYMAVTTASHNTP